MRQRTDLAVYDREGSLIVAVEVKNKLNTSPEWAAGWRRNLLAHGSIGQSAFVLLVTPDKLYVWTGNGSGGDTVPPDYTVDSQAVLKPYFDSARLEPAAISGAAFELIVGAWLADLASRRGRAAKVPASLRESGLLESVLDGRVEYDVAA